ncbi:MAG: LysR substrate-binding domain-containing protein [Microlunatus sp.]
MAHPSRPNLTLVQLRYFVAAATKHSMTEASVDLHVAQSAVSTAIAQLERSLNAQLFVRQRSKGLALTSAGVQLLRDAQSLLTQVDEMTDGVRGHHHDIRGTLRLACFVTLAPFLLPLLISRVEREHPRLRIEIIEADADGTCELLLNGTAESAISYDFGQVHDLHFDRLYSAAPMVILPAAHGLATEPEVRLNDLRNEHLVLLDLPRSREYFLEVLASAGVLPEVRYSSRSYETVRSLVARGQGYTILNSIPHSPKTYDGGELVALPIADEVRSLDVCVLQVSNVRQTARARVIRSLAHSLFDPNPDDSAGDDTDPASPGSGGQQ